MERVEVASGRESGFGSSYVESDDAVIADNVIASSAISLLRAAWRMASISA